MNELTIEYLRSANGNLLADVARRGAVINPLDIVSLRLDWITNIIQGLFDEDEQIDQNLEWEAKLHQTLLGLVEHLERDRLQVVSAGEQLVLP